MTFHCTVGALAENVVLYAYVSALFYEEPFRALQPSLVERHSACTQIFYGACVSLRPALRRTIVSVDIALLLLAAVSSMMPVGYKWMFHLKGPLHPWFHIGLFCWLAATCELLPHTITSKGVLILCLTAFGVGIEFAESARFQAGVEYLDIWADILGITTGVLASLTMKALHHRLACHHS